MKSEKTKEKLKAEIRFYVRLLMTLLVVLIFLIWIAIGMYKRDFGSHEKTASTEKQTMMQTETESELENETEMAYAKQSETGMEFEKEDSLLILINKENPIPDDYDYELAKLPEGHHVDVRAYDDLMVMLSDASRQGYHVVICSSWRSREVQERLFQQKIEEYRSYGYSETQAGEMAAMWVAIPGTSEHELGLALDIVSENYQQLNEKQADTPEQQWLMAHCHEYGFILRYPENKEEMTGIHYEPWHYRYVGHEAAAEIMERGLCLEEYLEE